MIYLKSILVGVTAFALTVIVFSMMAVAVMWQFPEVAARIFPGQWHSLGWGGYFDFPLWQIVIVGLLHSQPHFDGCSGERQRECEVGLDMLFSLFADCLGSGFDMG